jgi:hypothetical protein
MRSPVGGERQKFELRWEEEEEEGGTRRTSTAEGGDICCEFNFDKLVC